MRRKLMLAVILSILVPTIVHAWTLSAKIGSGLGTISNGTVTVSQGTGYFSAAAGTAQSVTVAPAAGYALSQVVLDGVNVTHPGNNLYSVSSPDNKAHSLVAYFTPVTTQVNLTQSAGGIISAQQTAPVVGAVTQTSLTGLRDGAVVRVSAAPNVDYAVTRITVAGATVWSGTSETPVTYSFAVSGTSQVSATFAPVPRVKALLTVSSVTAATGTSVQLDASGSVSNDTPLSYAFSVASGDASAVQLTVAGGGKASFTASAPGSYTVAVTVTSNHGATSTALSPVVTVQAAGAYGSQLCIACHSGRNQTLVTAYLASPHAAAGAPTCASCHNPDNTSHFSVQRPVGSCSSCHLDSSGNVPLHPFDIGSNLCTGCHDPHSTIGGGMPTVGPHFNNVTGAGYPASYVTSRSACTDCHYANAANATVRKEWAASGHAAVSDAPWTEYDFKTRSGCVQCHTTTGFIAFSTAKKTAAWGVASDKTKEVLTCVACHSDITTGAVRKVTPVKPFADDSYQNRNVGTSNICFDCHSGRNNGNSIAVKVGSANFGNLPFIAPHYLAAGGDLHGKSGYHFPGQTYAFYSSNSHRLIGMGNRAGTGSAGPCVACHMSATQKHLFEAAVVDGTGAVTAISTTLCVSCHGDSLDATKLAQDQAAFAASLDVLKAMLADKGFVYSANYPYFGNTNWGSGQAGANAMGAAYNYKLLLAEPGAFAHNAAYARKLIADSIDVLYNGSVTGNIDSALAYLVGKGAITQDAADALTAYQKGNSCASCHTATTGSHTAHLSRSIGCAECHADTAASATALVPGTQTHLNGVKDVALANGGSYAGGTCSTVYCHSNGASAFTNPTWGNGPSTCVFCHPLSSLRGAHAAHVGSLIPTSYGDTTNYSTAGEYRFGCGTCHPTAVTSHADHHIDVTLIPTSDGSPRSKNKTGVVTSGVGNSGSGIDGVSGSSVTCSAAYCHSDGKGNFVASPDWYVPFTGDRCAMCHGNAPATGAHAAHAVGIHYANLYDGGGNLLPAAAPAGQPAGHGDAAQSTTIGCYLCHSATVTNSANDNNGACTSCHVNPAKGTPTLDKTRHLNGTVEISFRAVQVVTKAQVRPSAFGQYSTYWTRTTYKAGGGSYDTSKLSLSQAGWDGTGKSCSNVACHNGGTPNWNGRLSCVDCHSAL